MRGFRRLSRLPGSGLTLGAIGLLVLLTTLALLQYRWAGELSAAELVRLRAVAQARATEFARAFDREITRAFLLLGVRRIETGGPELDPLVRAYRNWQSDSPHPQLVKSVYWLRPDDQVAGELLMVDGPTGTLVRATCPPELAPAVARFRFGLTGNRPLRSDRPFGPIDDVAPALVIPALNFRTARDRPTPRDGPSRWPAVVLVLLDLESIRSDFLPALQRRYFDPVDGFDYHVRVLDSANTPLFSSAGEFAGTETPDASVRLFDIRLGAENKDLLDENEATLRGALVPTPPSRGPQWEGSGRWRVDLWNRAGSLPRVVTAARQRNLAISFGILGLLGASVVLLLTAARRAERLARRQVEFVAGVTHEVRTPITVILSAAENLADGIVTSGSEMRTYGALVRDEARRLRDMVEQILELAGADTGRPNAPAGPVQLDAIIADVVKSCTAASGAGGIAIRTEVAQHLPPVLGDAVALRRVVRNLIENAIKYAGVASWVGVRAEAKGAGHHREVVLTIQDGGLGIGTADLPHIFEPFYRGAAAISRRIPGSGLGLSLVHRIVESHGGRIAVDSVPEQGSTFVVSLPAAADVSTPGAVVAREATLPLR